MSSPESARNDFLTAARPALPYPGLRPFDTNEWSIFFGRERMIDEVMDRLAAHRLVMIYGSSGSGKSSLVRAGVLPKLARQHLRAGVPWRTCTMRPAGGPLWNLAKEFARLEGTSDNVERVGQIVGMFNRRDATLSAIVGSLNGLAGERVCVLVDQFEELFRFEKETSREEAELFVELLVRSGAEIVRDDAAGAQPAGDSAAAPVAAAPVAAAHVVVTMRSEYLGECARFDELAEAINRTQYLVPRMDRDGLTRAIRRPASLYGGEVSFDLTERLIADVAGREDELPILQHVLMRCWEYRQAHGGNSRPIGVDDYQAIGGMADALSQHADEAYDGLPNDAQRDIARRMFQALTEKTADNIEIRRPTSVAALAEITNSPITDIMAVVEAFRRPDRSFLMPPADVPLDAKSLIDISHESLIRRWRRMRKWVDEEAESARVYRRLAETAFLHAQGRAALLRDPDLETALRWSEREKPNATWAIRYHPGFDQANAFLKESQLARAAEQRQRQSARRHLQVGGGLVTAAIAVFAVVCLLQWRAASRLNAQLHATNANLIEMQHTADDASKRATAVVSILNKTASSLVFRTGEDTQNFIIDVAVQTYTFIIGEQPTSDAYQGRGVAYRQQGKLDLAMQDFNKAIELDAANTYAYNSRGNAYLDQKDYKDAIADYTQAIKLMPTYAYAYDNRGDAYDDEGDTDDAIADYTKAIELDAEASFYNDRGIAYFHKKDYNHAIADYTQAIKMNPKYAAAYDNRGDANRDKGDTDQALADYSAAIGLDRTNAAYYFDRGFVHDHRSEYDDAIEDYSEAIKLKPEIASYYDALGDMYYDKKQYDRAITEYTNAISRDGQNALYYGDRGDAYRKQVEYDHAIADYTKAIEIDPKNAGYYDGRAAAYDKLGDYDSAIADYNKAIAINPQDDDATRNRDLDQTISQYSKAITANQNDADAYKSRAAAYDQKGNYSGAIDDYSAAIELAPNDADAYRGRAGVYLDNSDYDHAIADYSKAIALDTSDIDAYKGRATAYYDNGNSADAIADLTKAISLDPDDASAYLDRGQVYSKSKDYQRAIADYTKAIGLGRNDANAYKSRGNVYYYAQQYANAIADYTKAIGIDPQDPDAYDDRGNAYDDSNDHAKAIADYNKAIALNPAIAGYFVDRAVAYYAVNDFSSAITDNTRAIALDPNNAAAYKHRADDYGKLGKYDPAIEDYTQAIVLDANDADIYDSRGNAYVNRGEYDRAIADFSKSISLFPKRAVAYVDRGLAYYGKGDNARAIADDSEAISLDDKNGGAYFNRGVAYLYSGALSKALADLERDSVLDPQYPYMALWLEIVDKRSNVASRLAQTTAKLDLTQWPVPIIRLYLGQATPADVLAAAESPDPLIKTNQVCEANFYTGEYLLQQGDKDEAARLFRAAAIGCPKGYLELPAARAELGALGQNPDTGSTSGRK